MEASWLYAICQGMVVKSACGTLGRQTTSNEALLLSVGSYSELLEINHTQCPRAYVLMQPVGLDKLARQENKHSKESSPVLGQMLASVEFPEGVRGCAGGVLRQNTLTSV
jgi:hypothetical protein